MRVARLVVMAVLLIAGLPAGRAAAAPATPVAMPTGPPPFGLDRPEWGAVIAQLALVVVQFWALFPDTTTQVYSSNPCVWQINVGMEALVGIEDVRCAETDVTTVDGAVRKMADSARGWAGSDVETGDYGGLVWLKYSYSLQTTYCPVIDTPCATIAPLSTGLAWGVRGRPWFFAIRTFGFDRFPTYVDALARAIVLAAEPATPVPWGRPRATACLTRCC